jgi:biotin transport system permease protein
MLNSYRPGTGRLHRLPAAPKTLLLLALSLSVFLLPPLWWSAAAATATSAVVYSVAGLRDGALGMRELGRLLFTVRWVIAIMLVNQLIFLGPESAMANAARVAGGLSLAALITLTTPVNALLDSAEHALGPLRHLRIDPQRIALLLPITLSTVPALARIATDVRTAQRARGARTDLRSFAMPFLVMSLKYADQLGDALVARGVR